MLKHSYNYGIIGNGSLLAYIDQKGSIDWMCYPHFSGVPVFNSLINPNSDKAFKIILCENGVTSTQNYIPHTNILVTTLSCSEGSIEITDILPRYWEQSEIFAPKILLRKVRRLKGHPSVKIHIAPTLNYSSDNAESVADQTTITYFDSNQALSLWTNASTQKIADEQSFILHQDLYFAFGQKINSTLSLSEFVETALARTSSYWTKWVEHCRLPQFFTEEVIRSALVLKMHQYEETGAIIAAGTTSLPEHPGSGRNWDYRYCWVRDSYFTLNALQQLNHFEESVSYSHFIENIAHATDERIQPLFSIFGQTQIEEFEINWQGYKGEQPVRVGNAAYSQIQNDAYGQVLLALTPLFSDHRTKGHHRIESRTLKKILRMQLVYLNEPDAGIWEFRGKMRVHCNTLLFAWMGAREVLKLKHDNLDSECVGMAQDILTQAAALIERCYDNTMGAYTTSPSVRHLNASELLLITSGYLDARSEKAKQHLKAIEQQLSDDEGFVFRYKEVDDFGDTTSSFMICNFWFAEALAVMNDFEKFFRSMKLYLSTANHLGLMSEDVDPKDHSQWGNFPQTYSHVGVINAAFRIQRIYESMSLRDQDLLLEKFSASRKDGLR